MKVALVLSQPREMHSVGLLGLIGAIAILVPCVGIVTALLLGNTTASQLGNATATSNATAAPTALVARTALIETGSTAVQRISAVMSICYAYGGQNIFCELQVRACDE